MAEYNYIYVVSIGIAFENGKWEIKDYKVSGHTPNQAAEKARIIAINNNDESVVHTWVWDIKSDQ
jgi:hypothetical protein